jgi:hypothetical protein
MLLQHSAVSRAEKEKAAVSLPLTENPQVSTKLIIAKAEAASQRNSQAELDGTSQLGHHRSVETRCAECGAAMTCRPEGACWCAELPHVPMPADAERCLCRNCLLAKIEALQKSEKIKEA